MIAKLLIVGIILLVLYCLEYKFEPMLRTWHIIVGAVLLASHVAIATIVGLCFLALCFFIYLMDEYKNFSIRQDKNVLSIIKFLNKKL